MSVSVVIPAYNLEDHIERCLNSVMSQSVKPDEVIVVDDGSTDKTCEIVSKFENIVLIKQKNMGPAAARNKGVEASSCEWVSFLDGDDEFLPHKVEYIKNKIHEIEGKPIIMIGNDQEEGVLGGPYKEVELHKYFNPELNLFLQLFQGCFLSTASITVKRKIFSEIGGMDVTLPSAQDYDTWLRLSKMGDLIFIKKVLTRCIEREGSISFNAMRRYECLLIILEKYKYEVNFKDYFCRLLVIHYEVANMLLVMSKYSKLLVFVVLTPINITKYIARKAL